MSRILSYFPLLPTLPTLEKRDLNAEILSVAAVGDVRHGWKTAGLLLGEICTEPILQRGLDAANAPKFAISRYKA